METKRLVGISRFSKLIIAFSIVVLLCNIRAEFLLFGLGRSGESLKKTENSPFGMAIDIQNGYYRAKVLKELGVRWQRRSTIEYPHVIGKNYAKLDWDAVREQLVRTMSKRIGNLYEEGYMYDLPDMYDIREQGIEPIVTMSSRENPPKDMTDYRQYVYYLVDHLANKSGLNIRRFSIGNEPNYRHFFKGTVEEYAEMMRSTIEEIKRACPTALISHGSVAFIQKAGGPMGGTEWFKWYGKLFEYRYANGKMAKDLFNCSDIHYYGKAEDLPERVREWYSFLEKYQIEVQELWITEAAMPSLPKGSGIGEIKQALYLVKLYIIVSSLGVDALCWFSLNDRITSRESNKARNMGLCYVEDKRPVPSPSYRKQSFWAYKNLSQLTKDLRWNSVRRIDTSKHPNLWAYQAETKKGGSIFFFWFWKKPTKSPKASLGIKEKFVFEDRLNGVIPRGKYHLVELVPKGKTGKIYEGKQQADFLKRKVEVTDSLKITLGYIPVALIPVSE